MKRLCKVLVFFWEKTIPFLPESMEVENYPTWKETTIGGNYFFTSVIMGGRVYHACRLPWLGELLEKTTYQTNTLYGRLSALSWKPDDSEAGNNYMHWTTGFFSNLPSVLAKEAPTKSRGNEMLKHVDSSMINTSSFRWAFPPGVNAKQKWLNKLLIRESWRVFKLNPQKVLKSCHGLCFEALLIYIMETDFPKPFDTLPAATCIHLILGNLKITFLWAGAADWVVYFRQKKYCIQAVFFVFSFLFFVVKGGKICFDPSWQWP